MEWMIREYMTKKHIPSLAELARLTGIEYRTLINHINDIGKFRIYEVIALDNVLSFKDEDLLRIMRGAVC